VARRRGRHRGNAGRLLPPARSGDRPGARPAAEHEVPVRVHGDARTARDLLADAEGRPRGEPRSSRAATPGPRETFTISIDTRERYPYRFAGRDVLVERATLQAGDYAILADGDILATVERKTLENFASSLSDGTIAFQLQRLGEAPRAAVVVEARYSALFKLGHMPAAWIADVLARLQVRYPEIQVIFADSRKFAEEWTYRFLAAALAEAIDRAP
jgi:ERCC4-type nuclease